MHKMKWAANPAKNKRFNQWTMGRVKPVVIPRMIEIGEQEVDWCLDEHNYAEYDTVSEVGTVPETIVFPNGVRVDIGDLIGAGCFRAAFDATVDPDSVPAGFKLLEQSQWDWSSSPPKYIKSVAPNGYVLKVAKNPDQYYQNLDEFEVYQYAKARQNEGLFPEHFLCSPCGKYLLVEKVTPLVEHDLHPSVKNGIQHALKGLYPWIGDLHSGNIGVREDSYKDQFILIDMGLHGSERSKEDYKTNLRKKVS